MTKRLPIITNQKEMWDYEEFRLACAASGVPPLALGEWAQKLGMLVAAQHRYPGMPNIDAYMKLVSEMDYGLAEATSHAYIDTAKPCNTCGGGKVL